MSYKEKETTTVTVVYTTKVYQLRDNLDVIYRYTNGDFTGTELRFHPKLLIPIEKRLRPFYGPIKFKTDILAKGINPYSEDIEWDTAIPEDINDIDVSRIYLAYRYGNLMFSLDEKILPLSYGGSYSDGSFDNTSYHLTELLGHLKEHPMVIKDYSSLVHKDNYLTIKEVPYYNNDDGNRKHIAFRVLPEANSYNELFLKVFIKNRAENFTTKLKDMVMGDYGHMAHGVDYLGLEPFRKRKKRQKTESK